MSAASKPPNESQRLTALYGLHLLDTPPEERFDRITRLATRILNVPISNVSLIDRDRQFNKSHQGSDMQELPREHSFCAHSILAERPFVVPDARIDPRCRPSACHRQAGHPLPCRAAH
jgi:GAF domain-containing protein